MEIPNSELVQIENWTVRVRRPAGAGPHPVLALIHGWTGDENSMWVFTTRLPKDALLIAPRALHPAATGGYSWHPEREHGLPEARDLLPAVDALLNLLTSQNFPDGDFNNMRFAGFSQGAALVYTLALTHPEKVRALAGLAGFMPGGVDELIERRPLAGKPAFVAHGTQDERVPVQRARIAVDLLERAGAEVDYCEADVGHKLSADCFRALGEFFDRHHS